MAQMISGDGNCNQNGTYSVMHMARQRWQSKQYGEYNALLSGGDDDEDHCVQEEWLAGVAILTAPSLDQSSSPSISGQYQIFRSTRRNTI